MTTISDFPTLGAVAITTGIFGLLAVVFIILMFTVGGPFGTLNDIFNSLMAISSLLLAWMIYSLRLGKPIVPGALMLIITVIGTLIAILGSVLVIFRFTGYFLAGLYTALGFAFIGIFLLLLNFGALRDSSLPRSLAISGIACGVIMLFGFAALPGILKSIDAQEQMPKTINYLWQFSFLGTYILFPIWCIWLGRLLLRP